LNEQTPTPLWSERLFDFCFAGLQWANMPFSPKRYLRFCPKKGKSCGAGGIRTHVQTGKPYAFYTLIPAFGFRALARPGPPTNALSPKISFGERGHTKLFPISLHRYISWLRNNSL